MCLLRLLCSVGVKARACATVDTGCVLVVDIVRVRGRQCERVVPPTRAAPTTSIEG